MRKDRKKEIFQFISSIVLILFFSIPIILALDSEKVEIILPKNLNSLSPQEMRFWNYLFNNIRETHVRRSGEDFKLVAILGDKETEEKNLEILRDYKEKYEGSNECNYIVLLYNTKQVRVSEATPRVVISSAGKCKNAASLKEIPLKNVQEVSNVYLKSKRLIDEVSAIRKKEIAKQKSLLQNLLYLIKQIVNTIFKNSFNHFCEDTFGEFPQRKELGTTQYKNYFEYFKERESEPNRILFVLAHATDKLLNLIDDNKAGAQLNNKKSEEGNKEIVIIKGELTALGEGRKVEGSNEIIGIPNRIYWASSSSGVTLGWGYDLSKRNNNMVAEDLRKAGLKDEKKIGEIAALAGKTENVEYIVKNKIDKIGELPSDVLLKLYENEYHLMERDVIQRATNFSEIYKHWWENNCLNIEADEKYLSYKNAQLTQNQWKKVDIVIKALIADLRINGEYTGDIYVEVNKAIINNERSLLKQLEALREVFKEGGIADQYMKRNYVRNRIRYDYLTLLIKALKSGKRISLAEIRKQMPDNTFLPPDENTLKNMENDLRNRATNFAEMYKQWKINHCNIKENKTAYEKYLRYKGAQFTKEEWNKINNVIKDLIVDLRYQGAYVGDIYVEVNKAIINNKGNLLKQLEALQQIFKKGGVADKYFDKVMPEKKITREIKERFYGLEVDMKDSYRRNRIRYAYLTNLINALKSGKRIRYVTDMKELAKKSCVYVNNIIGQPIERRLTVENCKSCQSQKFS